MSVEELAKAAIELSAVDRARLRHLLDEIDEATFDAKIERDALGGKLDRLAKEALEDVRAGRYREL